MTIFILISVLLAALLVSGCVDTAETSSSSDPSGSAGSDSSAQVQYRTVADMRGKEVVIPSEPQRVVAISRSLIDTTMYIFGVEDRIVGGSVSEKPLQMGQYMWNGTDYTVNTWIGKILSPELDSVTNVGGFGGPYGLPNVETIASLNPDLLILRDLGDQDENTEKFISQIDAMGIPVVVLKYPSCYDEPGVETMYEEIRLLGEVFGKEDRAEEIVDTVSSRVEFIRSRTVDIPEEEQKRVLYFGAPTWAKDKGGAGYAFGSGSTEMAMMEDIINSRSAYTEPGTNMVSAEQILSLDPDKIILCTYSGYHPPRQLYDDSQYSTIQDLRALREGEVYSLAATPCKSERLEFPINLMIEAKAVYPEHFSDVELEPWIRDYFVELYGTNETTTDEMMDALMLEYLEIV